jgi:DNA-binding NtrC family response regulator
MSQIRVFYLDDEEELLSIFKETFESETVLITTFSNPKNFIKQALKSPPHLAFLDYRLPSTTGIEVAKEIPSSIQKVLITGDLNLSRIDGFLAILTKPFPIPQIVKILEEAAKT